MIDIEIFKLFGSIFVDSKDAQDSISKTGEQADTLGGKLSKGIGTAAKWGAAIAGAAVAVGGAMFAAAGKIAGTADEIDKASRRAGTDAETWQKLDYAMGQSGISSEKLEKSMVKNQKALNEAAKGTEAYADAYDKLGVSIYDTDGKLRESDDVYQDTLKSLADLEDMNQRNALANEIFGKSYSDLAPILDSGSQGIDDLMSRAEQLNLILGQDTVDAGVKFGDTMDDMKQMGGAFFNMIAAELLPFLQLFLDWIIEHAPEIKVVIEKVVDGIKLVLDGLKEFWEKNGESIKKIVKAAWKIISSVVEGAMKAIKGVIDVICGIINGDWEQFWDGIVGIVTGIGSALYNAGKAIFSFLWNGLKSVWTSISNWVSEKVSWLVDKLTFWKSSKDEMSNNKTRKKDGSHASGLRYVPYDGYIAELHKGETILNASSSKGMVTDIVNSIAPLLMGNSGGQYTINLVVDEKVLAQTLFEPLKDVSKQKGVALG